VRPVSDGPRRELVWGGREQCRKFRVFSLYYFVPRPRAKCAQMVLNGPLAISR